MAVYTKWAELKETYLQFKDDAELYFGGSKDVAIVWDGTNFTILPVANDTGALHIGDGTTDFDVKVFLGATTKYVLLDVGNSYFTLEDVDMQIGDNDRIQFGDASGGDVYVAWNGSVLAFLPAVDDTGYIAIGNGTKDLDFTVFLGTNAKYVNFDVGNSYFKLEDVDLRLGDNDQLQFGDASGGDISVKWNASLLQMLPNANDTGYFAIGNGSLDIDFRVYTGVGKYLLVDVGNDYLSLVNLSLYAPNLATSAGQAGIVYVNASGYLIQSD